MTAEITHEPTGGTARLIFWTRDRSPTTTRTLPLLCREFGAALTVVTA
jgi:hypothetical protein